MVLPPFAGLDDRANRGPEALDDGDDGTAAMRMTPPKDGGPSLSQQYVTQPSQTVPAFGPTHAGVPATRSDNATTQPSSKKRKAVPDWVHYDADIVDNLSKTRRFASECMSDDLVSRMSISGADDGGMGGEKTGGATGVRAQTPSPLSKYKVWQRGDGDEAGAGASAGAGAGASAGASASAYQTPVKGRGQRGTVSMDEAVGTGGGSRLRTRRAIPAKLFEAELSVTTSPSDVKMGQDGGTELRKTALVRLALLRHNQT